MERHVSEILKADIAPISKIMYLYFCMRADEKGRAAVRYKDIAKNVNISSTATVHKYANALVKAGLITKDMPMEEGSYTGSNVYTICNWKG